MQTKVVKIDPFQIDENEMKEAAELIRKGELVAFPTETVYGLGADALHPEASKKIYAAKGRPSDNPLIVHICKFEELVSIAKEVPAQAEKLADAMARYIREGGLPPCELDIKTDGNVTHTIPQKVSGKKSFRLAMRVRRPMKDGAIEITQDGKTVKRYKFKKALPAEMIQIPVEAEKLNGEAPLEVNVIC